MNAVWLVISALSLAIWLYMLLFRGGFWLARERDDRVQDAGHGASVAHARKIAESGNPSVTVVIPARDEAESIAQTVQSLLRQDYVGQLRVVVVDDHSSDGTAQLARAAASAIGEEQRLVVITGRTLPTGWTGKLWAVNQGIVKATLRVDADPTELAAEDTDSAPNSEPASTLPEFLLLTDADIVHAADNVRRLVARAQAGNLVLVSLMAKLRSDALIERALVPAFVLFFQMVYPFAWVNRRDHALAAAAGGCMLVRRDALEAAGGVASIRGEIIDDCALGAKMKQRGAIWLGLTERAVSVRSYESLGELRRMVARTAYAQLKYSPLLLAGTIVSLLVTFIAPPVLAIAGHGAAGVMGALAWLAIAVAYQPMLRFYRRAPWWGLLLPAIAALYTVFTFDSALQHWRGRGGMWKGRAQAKR
jgi:hopene-associated glycosyltransferase HpnB